MASAEGGVSFLYRFSAVDGALIPQPDKYDAGHAQGYEGSFLGLLMLSPGAHCVFGLF